MVDNSGDDSSIADSLDNRPDLQAEPVTSVYKVLGQFTSDTGVGVLGQNDAGSGTPIGVQGAVPNATSSGYGLYTSHDAMVGQTLELGALGGSIVGGATVDDLTGPGLSTGTNSLRIGNGAITTTMLGQNGASDGQTFVWDDGTSQWTTGAVGGSSKWEDSDGNSLLEPSGSETGIDVSDVRTDTLADDDSGAVSLGAPMDLNGNDLVDGGTTIWDTSVGAVPAARLSDDSVSVAGNPVSLGGSTGVSHGDLSGIGSSDHHSRPSAGTGLDENAGSFDVNPADFAGSTLEDVGSNTLEVAADSIGTSELADPFPTLSDLFGIPVTPGAAIETEDPIETSIGNVLRLKVYGRALAMVAGGYDIPSEGGGISAPNVVAGAHNSTGGGSPRGAVVGGGGSDGDPNVASANFAVVCGGEGNTASEYYASVLGGDQNTASAFSAVAAGSHAAAESSDSFVFNDGTGFHSIPNTSDDGLSSNTAVNGENATGTNSFSVGATGGVRFITGSSEVVHTTDGSAGWSATSTRSAKTNLDPVDPTAVLAGVEEMAVTTWEYKDDDGDGKGITHIGPTAEAFHEVVDVGDSDEHINSVNADGVAFAAIQGLADRVDETREAGEERDERLEEQATEAVEQAERIEELEAETSALRAENEQLRERLAGLEERLATLDGGDAGAAAGAD